MVPTAEGIGCARGVDVSYERNRRATIVSALGVDEVMIIEGIEEISLQLEVHLFRDLRVFGQGHVKVSECWTVDGCNCLAGARVAEG